MEFEQILKLIDHVSQSPLTSFQYEGEHLKLSMERAKAADLPNMQPPFVQVSGMPNMQPMQVTGMPNMQPPFMQGAGMVPQVQPPYSQNNPAAAMAASQQDGTGDAGAATQSSAEVSNLKIVKSPLVGVFYAAPAEDADAFVRVGDKVKQGQILSIVEAMKLMNEIESEFDGEIAEIYVENGETVEYGQPLFGIR